MALVVLMMGKYIGPPLKNSLNTENKMPFKREGVNGGSCMGAMAIEGRSPMALSVRSTGMGERAAR